jgi:hypothetical protein
VLRSAYNAGFNTLLQVLAVFTLLTGVIVYLCLGQPSTAAAALNPR